MMTLSFANAAMVLWTTRNQRTRESEVERLYGQQEAALQGAESGKLRCARCGKCMCGICQVREAKYVDIVVVFVSLVPLLIYREGSRTTGVALMISSRSESDLSGLAAYLTSRNGF